MQASPRRLPLSQTDWKPPSAAREVFLIRYRSRKNAGWKPALHDSQDGYPAEWLHEMSGNISVRFGLFALHLDCILFDVAYGVDGADEDLVFAFFQGWLDLPAGGASGIEKGAFVDLVLHQ